VNEEISTTMVLCGTLACFSAASGFIHCQNRVIAFNSLTGNSNSSIRTELAKFWMQNFQAQSWLRSQGSFKNLAPHQWHHRSL